MTVCTATFCTDTTTEEGKEAMTGRGQGGYNYQLGRGYVPADSPSQTQSQQTGSMNRAPPPQSFGTGRGFTPGRGGGYGGPDWTGQQAGFGVAPQGWGFGRVEPRAYSLGTGRGFVTGVGRGTPRHPGTPRPHPASGPRPASAGTKAQGVYSADTSTYRSRGRAHTSTASSSSCLQGCMQQLHVAADVTISHPPRFKLLPLRVAAAHVCIIYIC